MMKRISIIVILLFIYYNASSQSERMIDQIRAHNSGTAVWWAGHNSWIIRSGDLVVGTDLYLEDSPRIVPSPITPEELATVIDISFVTHAHGDHFNGPTSRVLLEKSNCIFVLPESCLQSAQKIGIPGSRIKVAKPREPFDIQGIHVNPLRAIHGDENFAIYIDANLQDCGYVMTIDGKTFLQPGDSYLLEDHLFLKHVDVLFFSPTEHNMYIDRSLILINTLEPDYIFPQHHSTIAVDESNRFWANGYPYEVRLRLTQALKDRYYILKPGEMREIR
ncbi:MAG TPA: MBL fold metallo-hydrolase [Cyclobacteriaceae bacterium]|nr:MBL fold metallo-hydrolase [Cyclobacteriaceae bacterium]